MSSNTAPVRPAPSRKGPAVTLTLYVGTQFMLVAAMALDRYPAVQCPGTGVVMADRYDTLVIGGGMAGLPLALRAARHGRVAFVEKKNLAEPA